MKRKIEKALAAWKTSQNRKPLLVQGARQVGKTHSIVSFGKDAYLQVAYCMFEGNQELRAIFEQSLEPERLIALLSAYLGMSITQGSTLLVFDEVQACPPALTSLKYFNEQAPSYHVIATGSLLGVSLSREDTSFPVGQIDTLQLHPLDFEEYLWARGKEALADAIRQHAARVLAKKNCPDSSFPFHKKSMGLLRQYLVTGGMPSVVDKQAQGEPSGLLLAEQKTIDTAYVGDMAKYATPEETLRITRVWDSMVRQLAKENKKFQYKAVHSGARSSEYETALFWLEKAALLNRCNRVSLAEMPLVAYEDPTFFKEYMLDCGILFSKLGLAPDKPATDDEMLGYFNGAFTENYVMQALTARGIRSCYWSPASGIEVDFVLQRSDGAVIPVEVKHGSRTSSASLNAYTAKFSPEYSVTVSAKDFGYVANKKSVPPYALFCLEL
jgi:predicted AAA+ superfamily ATPase